ncbi:hypothetical protein FC605_11720 [Bacillus subtilis]|uniref:hypothetical protein n=1 Tax=Bacillus subtilis TaxID=1423 RepID=UPI0009B64950|nr:hypothetical protein [Bacillus subtilis]ARB37558.1 hypothetical protein BSK2_11645 [Bacillus subtilis]QCU15473.1 hypothetical protein FC605_11720 [Bacillus subtilis]
MKNLKEKFEGIDTILNLSFSNQNYPVYFDLDKDDLNSRKTIILKTSYIDEDLRNDQVNQINKFLGNDDNILGNISKKLDEITQEDFLKFSEFGKIECKLFEDKILIRAKTEEYERIFEIGNNDSLDEFYNYLNKEIKEEAKKRYI